MSKIKAIIWLLFSMILSGVVADVADDCFEVGFARSGGALPYQAYASVKDEILARWQLEDQTGSPSYKLFPGHLKNLTRAAYLLEAVSRDAVASIRKTRVGKRCKEEFLLRGMEKHVRPLAQLDEDLANHLQLVQAYQCIVGSPYPNVDGSCVSETSPDLGAVGSKFLRLLPASPGPDGFSPRTASDGSALPSAVRVSSLLQRHLQPAPRTAAFASWAHFLQQDVFSIPESPLAEGVDCCKTPLAEDCFPLLDPQEDPQDPKSQPQKSCLNFKRSARGQAILGHRESVSLVSTYLDANPLYGSTNDIAFTRKTGYFGLLKGVERLEESSPGCQAPDSWDGCFAPAEGDSDVVGGVRALLQLEHNRVAEVLSDLNPHFDDPLLYNEARRVVLAMYQRITYGEYLPSLMGAQVVEKHQLLPGTKGPAAAYIKEVIPGVLNSFALAAFRNPAMATVWHSSAPGRHEVLGSAHYDFLADLPTQDLLAADLHRARDHGLAGYVSWRRFCDPGLVLETWDDLRQIFGDALTEDLQLHYKNILDVDAMLALLEPPEEGGVVGKTFACIMADQFARLRTGNKLFWEFEAAIMTEPMQEAIKNVTLASLLCHNLPLHTVPRHAFLPISPTNPAVPCSEVPALNMTSWVDTSLVETMKAREAHAASAKSLPTPKSATNKGQDKKPSGTPPSDKDSDNPQRDSADRTISVVVPEDPSSSSSVLVTSGAEGGDRQPTERMAVPPEGTPSLTTSGMPKHEL